MGGKGRGETYGDRQSRRVIGVGIGLFLLRLGGR